MSTSTTRIATAALVISIVAIALGASTYVLRPGASQPKAFTINGREYSFDISSITVKAGDTVKITLKNTGTVEHEFLIVENKTQAIEEERGGGEAELPFGFEIAGVAPSQEQTVSFVATKSGDFFYVCLKSVGTEPELHAERGMYGQFTVET